MPLLDNTSYTRPKWLFSGHLETIYPSLFRKVVAPNAVKERILTIDGDFLDLDWYRQGKSKLVIISHGLEGNSTRAYMLGMVNSFLKADYDVLTWNFRSCSSEMNKQVIFYHSGATYDLDVVVQHACSAYDEINLVGFSLGGNLTLKYLGEKGNSLSKIHRGVAISVPLHLGSSSKKISDAENTLYSKRFLRSLKKKVIEKSEAHPGQIPVETLRNIKTLADFDDFFTGPLHGFADADEYYEVNSSLYFLDQIKVPTLVLNALNDPFLSEKCFPTTLAKSLDQVYFEFPKHGGHVGFSPANSEKPFYSEQRAVEFINAVI
ncbi:alpha/beta fold hydrolase [Algoriphagus sp. D3-2-R+10]|uniref:YheT family hydrolase n=1 Tax=Algoriphagus aurantiacus TaxID=3103948 RepID=UPI002B38B3A6|nr:alpha/beta fold hydrolase [Algoriphagus sp. D3-2-R+10]MEB2776260.1 alpha/beta fold hydrolase [Algoriphagus sp. D3-2-R+10]